MNNINELEAKWLKYKIKSYIPHAVIAISVIVIIVIILTMLNSLKTVDSAIVKSSVLLEETNHEATLPKDINTTQGNADLQNDINADALLAQGMMPTDLSYQKKEQIVLSPSLNFMKDMQGNTPPSYNETDREQSPSQQLDLPKNAQNKVFLQEDNAHESIEEVKPMEPIQDIKKEDSINIVRQNTQEDIEHVIQRFKKNNNPALSLFVAKKYYELGQYRQSYNYSLITNQLNNNIEASWIIFTKSLVKLDEKDMAIKTLKQYIEHSHSNQAKILLDEITSGKFK